MVTPLLEKILNWIGLSFEIVGVLIIVIGAVYSLGRYVFGKHPASKLWSLDILRLELGKSIVLGLEYFLAADIIRTIIAPGYYDLGLLLLLVIIRSIFTFLLTSDVEHLRALEKEKACP